MQITSTNYKDVIDNNLTVLKLGAEWCGPCKMIDPIFKEYEQKDLGVVIGVCDIDSSPEVAQAYSVRNIPTILFFKNGELIEKHVGVIDRTLLNNKIENLKSN